MRSQFSFNALGISLSQFSPSCHSSCNSIFDLIIMTAATPTGSNMAASLLRILCFVNFGRPAGLWCAGTSAGSALTLNENLFSLGVQIVPRTGIVVTADYYWLIRCTSLLIAAFDIYFLMWKPPVNT